MSVDSFWAWFVSVAPELEGTKPSHELIKELDDRILSLGKFGWEIGPGKSAPSMLAISPGGNRARFDTTRAIVGRAPEVKGWEIHAAKPARDWSPLFELEVSPGDSVQVDASSWRYVMLQYPDGAVEVLVEASNLSHLEESQRRWAVEIMLDGLLGEAVRLESIDELAVFLQFDEELAASAKPVQRIRHAFGLSTA